MYGRDGNDKIFGPDYVTGVGNDGAAIIYAGHDDDLLDLGDFNYSNYGYGGAGNDKIIGGQHYGVQKLYG